MAVAPADEFHIAFETREMPGFMLVTTVKLTRQMISNGEAEGRSFRIDLCDHPLYRALADYVKNNPPRD